MTPFCKWVLGALFAIAGIDIIIAIMFLRLQGVAYGAGGVGGVLHAPPRHTHQMKPEGFRGEK